MRERARHRDARSIVVGAVIKVVAVDLFAEAYMVQVSRVDDDLVGEFRPSETRRDVRAF